MTYRKTPANLDTLKKEAEAISHALLSRGQAESQPHTDIAVIFELISSAQAHLEEVRVGSYEDELERTPLDLAAAYASLAKVGARAVAVRMGIADLPKN
ncbi:hypothetical protein [Streptomyces carpinensis]|uniref:Uncharacterized protein n=1 Tax=Streptomyces carpinensis TaxID=66369 RepID=A0ABV1VUK9_9ACTN|nr:hypothetical protein [Streptomyces carpinensis]